VDLNQNAFYNQGTCLSQGLGFICGDTDIYIGYVTDLKISVADPGCLPGSKFFHPGSRIQGQKDSGSRIRIRIKEFMYFLPKNLFLSSQKYDQGCSSRIRISDTDLGFYPSRIQGHKGTGSRIRNRNTAEKKVLRGVNARFPPLSDDRGPRGYGEVPEGVRLQHLLRAEADGHRLRLRQAVDQESGHLRLRAPHHTGQFCSSLFSPFFWIFI
jgi:hypothetical protein